MADLKTTNIYGDAYINNKVGIATNAPATRLQIGQLSPTAATEGIQFGDDTSARIYRDSAGIIKVAGGFQAATYVQAGNYLQTVGNLIYPASQTATQRLEVGNASGNAWIDGLTIAQGGNVTVYNNLTSPSITVSGYITFPNDTNAAGLINTAGTAWLKLDDAYGNMYIVNNQSGAGIYFDSNAYYWRNSNGATTLLSLSGNGDLGAARYLSGTYVNTSDDVSTGNITHIVAKFGDNYHRSATAAKVAAFISGQTMNIVGTSTNITAYTINQNVGTANSPTFAGLSLTSVSTTGATITNLTGAYQNTTVYDSAKTQSATPSRGIRAPASSIQFTDSYAIAPFYTYRSTGDWPVPYGIGWGTGGESSGIFQRYASNGSSFGDMIFYTGNDGFGAFSFRRHTWEGTAHFAAGSGELNTELFRVDWSGNVSMLGTLNGSANSATLYPNNGPYGSWKIGGTRGGWYGIEFESGTILMANSSESGFYRNGVGWQMWWSGGTGYVQKGGSGGGTQATILESSNYTSYTPGLGTNNTLTGINTINNTSNTVINTLSGNLGLTMFQATAGTDAYMTFHIGSDYAAYFGLGGAENDLVYGGWSAGNNRHRILHSGNATYAWNMNQFVRTTDTCSFAGLTVSNTITGAVSGNAGTVTNGLYTTGGQTIAGITYFSNGESMNVYGIRGRFTNEYLHLYNKVGIGSPNGWGQGETSTPIYGLSTYGGLNIAYGDNGISTFNGVIRANSNIRQGADLARPLSSWSVSGTSTGMVIFSFPGNTGNYGMVHCVFDIYEYNSNTVSTVIVGGHNWNGAWYNTGANVIGRCGKSVRLGVKDSRYCVVFGGAASSWDYGTIILRKIHNGGFYTGIMDMGGSFTTQQTATESFSNISGDLRLLRTSADFIADGGVTGTSFSGAGTGLTGTASSLSIGGNAATATTLQTGRAINGVSFNGSAAITVNGLNYNVNNDWLRENGDDAHFQMYGNSRTMIYRTDGNTNTHGGGAYAHIFYYGGSADANRMFIINTDGRLWSNYHGWLDAMSISGNSATATTLQTARNINGTSFNGSAAITTANWGTARTLTIGSTGKSVDGSTAITWSLAEIGVAATNQTMFVGTTSVAINRASAAQTLTGVSIDGNAGTVTNGIYTTSYYTGTPLGKRRYRIHSADGTSLNSSIANLECGFTYGGSGEPTGPFIAFGGLGGSIDYSCQLAGAYSGGGNDFKIRTRNDDSSIWNTWRTLVTDGNYTSYSPTLTGTGASGTWSINVTGTAGSISGFNNPAVAATANTIVYRDGSGHIYGGYILGSYFNASAGNSENPTIGQIWTQNTTDNYLRKSTPAHFRSQVTDGSYPSLTGANASGTWSINITGNAGTATTAVSATSLAANTITQFKVINFTGVGGDSGNGGEPTSYGIYQQGGAWTHPYPDLCIGYHTGIKIGAYFGYGGTRFYNNSDWATEIFSVGNGDSNVRVVNTIYATTFSGAGTGLTGTAASLSIGGAAASATFLNSSNYINRCGSAGNANTDFQNTPAGSVRHNGDDSNLTNSPGGTWWFYDNYRHSNSSNYWGTQIAWGWEDNANRLATRNITGNSFGGWVYYLNSANYNSYSPTLTGTGASGTWSINVTGNAGGSSTSCSGNAATATALTSMNISQFTNNSGYLTSVTNISGNAATATTATNVGVGSGNTSAAWYPVVWHSGNTLFSSAGVQIYAGNNYVQATYFNSSDNDETGITRFVIKNGDGYHRSATTTSAADIIRGVASGTWSITAATANALNTGNTYQVANIGIGVSPSNRLHINGDGVNPTIRIDNTVFGTGSSNSRVFFGWLPISINVYGTVTTKYIQLYNSF